MAERPPRGYKRTDKPLPHEFVYSFNLNVVDETQNKNMCTFLRTSSISVDPATIKVNPRANSFAVDKGPLICDDSMVDKITISTSHYFSEHAMEVDRLQALALYNWNIHGAFADSWTPADVSTSTNTIAELLHVTSTAAQTDVVPETSGANLSAGNQPLSNITGPEVFGTYDLTTNAIQENTHTDSGMLDEIYDAKQYYTNGAFMNTKMGHINRIILGRNKSHMQTYERMFTPRDVKFGNPHMFFARQYFLPAAEDFAQILPTAISVTTGTHWGINVRVRFNEWNQEFVQSRAA